MGIFKKKKKRHGYLNWMGPNDAWIRYTNFKSLLPYDQDIIIDLTKKKWKKILKYVGVKKKIINMEIKRQKLVEKHGIGEKKSRDKRVYENILKRENINLGLLGTAFKKHHVDSGCTHMKGRRESYVANDGQLLIYSEGKMVKSKFVVSNNQWWNESDSQEAQVIFTIEPAGKFELMQEQIFGICNAKGKLGFLQIMVMAKEYDMIIAGPPIFIQKAMWAVLSPIGRLLGIKKYYPEYSL